MLNSKFHKICQPLISKLKFWIFPLFLSHVLCYLCKQKVIYALSQVDLEAPFQADLELEAHEFESNNNVPNETIENDSEPEKVHSNSISFKHLSSFDVFR